jgi:cell division protein FtsN
MLEIEIQKLTAAVNRLAEIMTQINEGATAADIRASANPIAEETTQSADPTPAAKPSRGQPVEPEPTPEPTPEPVEPVPTPEPVEPEIMTIEQLRHIYSDKRNSKADGRKLIKALMDENNWTTIREIPEERRAEIAAKVAAL